MARLVLLPRTSGVGAVEFVLILSLFTAVALVLIVSAFASRPPAARSSSASVPVATPPAEIQR